MKKYIFIIVFCVVTQFTFSQNVKCSDLFDYIIENGYKQSTLYGYTLNSSWLNKVTAYTYQYKTYVIAEIKKNDYDYSPKKYIFCGIPSQNWRNFQYGGYGDSDSYGERFHKYIIDYKCDCN